MFWPRLYTVVDPDCGLDLLPDQRLCPQDGIPGLRAKAEEIIRILRENPYQVPPAYEKLAGDLAGAYSRRINIQHRLIYQVLNDEKVIKIIRMWAHYE